MEVSGIHHDPLSDIQNIRRILKGYEVGLPIIKELMQNAEDAKATIMNLGWHPGFPDIQQVNPLLKAPALCMVNDGPFTRKNEESICTMGLGSKGADEHAIGRFGLGLKSVFHLSEAFFYLASDLQTGKNIRLNKLLNPWYPAHHLDWGTFSDNDESLMFDALKLLLPPKPWFALWIPLRQKSMCKNIEPIKNNCWLGEVQESPPQIEKIFGGELSDIFPMLKNLNEIRYWVWNRCEWTIRFILTLDKGSSKTLFPERLKQARNFKGSLKVVSDHENYTEHTYYSGMESWMDEEQFNDLKGATDWPKVVDKPENGADFNKDEKAIPHIGVYITRRKTNSGGGRLRIRWAVFLPIGTNSYDEVYLPDVPEDITLILHGYFFLNSDRTNLDGIEDHFMKDDSIYKSWNKRLARQGTLREVLPVMAGAFESAEFSDRDICNLVRHFMSSNLFLNFSDEICSDYQYAYLLTGENGKWKCIQSDKEIYSLPTPIDSNAFMPYQVFPNLKHLVQAYYITFSDSLDNKYPIITKQGYRTWPIELIKRLLSNIVPSRINHPLAADYLLSVLRSNNISPNIVEKFLCDLPLFEAHSYKIKESRRYSLRELNAFQKQGTLFLEGQYFELHGMLQSVCHDLDIVLIPKDMVNRYDISTHFEIKACDTLSCSESILRSRMLGSVDVRIKLMDFIFRNVSESMVKDRILKALRYLLHADPRRIDEISSLYMPKAGSVNETWIKMIRLVLDANGETWRVLDNLFAEHLSLHDLGICGIREISRESACGLLRESNVREIDFSDLNDNDRKRILIELDDLELLKTLPIHPRLGGGFVSLDARCFLQKDFHPEGDLKKQWTELLQNAIVIERLSDSVSRARQLDLMPELDWHAAMALALQHDSPGNYSQVIMTGLAEIGTPRQEVGRPLKAAAWLPIRDGGFVSPDRVIQIDGSDEEIHRVFSDGNIPLVSVLSLEDWVGSHRGFGSLKQQFPRLKDALQKLSDCLSERHGMKIGLQNMHSVAELMEFIKIFQTAPPELLPVCALLSSLIDGKGEESATLCYEILIPKLFGEIDKSRIQKILIFISEQHEQTTTEKRALYRKWFNRYLEIIAVEHDLTKSILPSIRLLNQKDEWMIPSYLVWPSEGLPEKNQLDVEQAKLLRTFREKAWREAVHIPIPQTFDIEKSAQEIIKYFHKFEHLVPSEVIGAVAALLGDHQKIKEWATKMLGVYSLDTIRADLMSSGTAFITNKSLEAIFKNIQFHYRLITTRTAKVLSITGNIFELDISDNPKSVLFGDGRELSEFRRFKNPILELIEIRNLSDFTRKEIESILRRTAEQIAYHVYYQIELPNFSKLWDRLCKTGQVSILSAQLHILNEADFYIKRLGVDRSSLFKGNMAKWDKAKGYTVESEIHPDPAQKQCFLEKAERLKKEAREELKKMLEENDDAHHALLNAIRDKMKSYQYDVSSVPFELFQNADDAYQELFNMDSQVREGITKEKPTFEIVAKEEGLIFVHWGRCINEFYRDIYFERGKELGFDRDLLKMMILSFSDKGMIDDRYEGNIGNVTGKFGLGFKTVFFVSDAPRVVSGWLAFDIRGGFYPKQLKLQDQERLQDKLQLFRPGKSRQGTLIELPFTNHLADIIHKIFDRFLPLVPFQLIFAKQIKSCSIRFNNQEEKVIKWTETLLSGSCCCFFGYIAMNDGKGRTILVLRPNRNDSQVRECSVLFQIGIKGFERIDSSIPSIWITSPTQEKTSCGFLVNGPFEPDVGRSRLSLSSKFNNELAKKLSAAVGDIWIDLFKIVNKSWGKIAESLRLSADISAAQLWDSLWDIMGSDYLLHAKKMQEGSADQIIFTIMWGNANWGYWKLINSYRVLPTRLWGEYNTFVTLLEINAYTSGLLNRKKIFTVIANWDSFRRLSPPGSVISGHEVYSRLVQLTGIEALKNCASLMLSDIITTEIGEDKRVNPLSGDHVGKLISQSLLDEVVSVTTDEADDKRRLIDLLKTFRFKADSGAFFLCRDLISNKTPGDEISQDEVMRAAFAPPDRMLSKEYEENALRLFALCRGKMNAPSEMLCAWAKEAKGEKLVAALRYLLNGELGREMANRLGHTWINAIMKTKEYDDLSADQKIELKWLFRIERFTVQGPVQVLPVGDLEVIYRWWMNKKAELISKYELEVFPASQPLDLTREDMGKIETDLSSRKKWIIMLMLGSFHTMGGTIPGQHRNFIELFIKKGWLEKLAQPDPSADSLLSILDEYLHDPFCHAEYYQWMKQFISFYQSSKWLSTYVFSLSEVDKMRNRFPLKAVFNVRDNSLYSGTGIGIEAPPLDRALGIGGCFLVRELVRRGLSNNLFAYEHAYVPSAGTRRILSMLGCSFPDGRVDMTWSSYIHTFLEEKLGIERSTFGLCFDIPFAVIAKHPDWIEDIKIDRIITEEPVDYFGE